MLTGVIGNPFGLSYWGAQENEGSRSRNSTVCLETTCAVYHYLSFRFIPPESLDEAQFILSTS